MSKANKTKKRVDITIVACPFCKAEAGMSCIFDPLLGYHLSRLDLAEIQIALDKRDAKIYLEKEAA